MSFTSIADHASEITGVSTSGASARVQGGETDLPKIPLSGGSSSPLKKGGKRRRSKKSQTKKRKSRGSRRHHRKTAKK